MSEIFRIFFLYIGIPCTDKEIKYCLLPKIYRHNFIIMFFCVEKKNDAVFVGELFWYMESKKSHPS